MGCVYIITNKINGKQYVGMTKYTAEYRLKRHIYSAINGSKFVFHKAIKKYGKENFAIETIYESNDISSLYTVEKFLINLKNTVAPNGYNSTLGGDGTHGLKFTKEHRLKISESMKGKHWKLSENTRIKMSEAHKGRVFSEESKNRMSKAHKGKTLSEEHKKNIAKARTGRKHSEETKKKISEAKKARRFNES